MCELRSGSEMRVNLPPPPPPEDEGVRSSRFSFANFAFNWPALQGQSPSVMNGVLLCLTEMERGRLVLLCPGHLTYGMLASSNMDNSFCPNPSSISRTRGLGIA